MKKTRHYFFGGVLSAFTLLTLPGCANHSLTDSPPVTPPLYLEIGQETSPLFGPGGFTQARQKHSELPRSEQREPDSPKLESPKADADAANTSES